MRTVDGPPESLQRCWTGFWSGLWLDHTRTFTELFLSNSCVVLAVLRLTVLLEDEPSVQSEVLNTLDSDLVLSVFSPFSGADVLTCYGKRIVSFPVADCGS